MKTSLRLAVVLAVLLAAVRVIAATVTTTFPVTATVLPTCRVAAGALAFGTYDTVAGTALDGQSTITVTCTQTAPYTVGLDAGAHAALATAGARAMANGTNHLDYNLYSDAGRTALFGGTATVAGAGTGTAQTVNVYGRIPASQNVLPLAYADSVTVTVTY